MRTHHTAKFFWNIFPIFNRNIYRVFALVLFACHLAHSCARALTLAHQSEYVAWVRLIEFRFVDLAIYFCQNSDIEWKFSRLRALPMCYTHRIILYAMRMQLFLLIGLHKWVFEYGRWFVVSACCLSESTDQNVAYQINKGKQQR